MGMSSFNFSVQEYKDANMLFLAIKGLGSGMNFESTASNTGHHRSCVLRPIELGFSGLEIGFGAYKC